METHPLGSRGLIKEALHLNNYLTKRATLDRPKGEEKQEMCFSDFMLRDGCNLEFLSPSYLCAGMDTKKTHRTFEKLVTL